MHDDINTKRTELANQMAAAGAANLDFTGTAAVLAAIPDTEPQQYVAAGTPENIAAILPATISPARRMRHGERPTDALVFDEPAATSGDAPTFQNMRIPERFDASCAHCGRLPSDAESCDWIECPAGGAAATASGDELAKWHEPSWQKGYSAGYNDAVGDVRAPSTSTSPAERAASSAGGPGDGAPKFPEPGYSNSLADRVFNLPCNWKGDQALHSAILMGHTMACEQAYNLVMADEQARAAVSAATKPTADLSKLARFDFRDIDGDFENFVQVEGGNYVMFHDVQSLLATKPAAAPAGRILAKVTKEMRTAGLAEANRRDCDADSSDVEMIFEAMLAAAPAASTTGAAQTADDTKLLDALGHASWGLEAFNMPTGGDDNEIGWRVIEYHMAAPHRRTVAEVYEDSPRAAIKAAIESPTPTHSSEAGDAS